jgi:hypothetical protein
MEENNQNQEPEQKQEPEQNKEQSSVENLIKNYDEKFKQMQENFEKKLADKDDIIRQLIMNNGKNEPELTDDEQSCQDILERINKRR